MAKLNFKGARILCSGATGSFGHALFETLKDSGAVLVCYSRDELKQSEMATEFKGFPVEFIVGDIRDRGKVFSSLKNVDYVFHAASLKQVPTGENFPEETIKTNILGTQNIVEGAEYNGVKRLVLLSTDKSAFPVGCYGASKLIAEKIVMAHKGDTINVCLRYGNVLGSRGSIVPLWLKQIRENQPLTITEKTMTRFVITLGEAVSLSLRAAESNPNDLIVMRPPATSIKNLYKSLELYYGKEFPKKILGVRLGEKLHETLLTAEENSRGKTEKQGNVTYVRVPANVDRNYFDQGHNLGAKDFTSLDAEQLNPEQVLAKLKEAKIL